jgi:hypothetical protein
MASPVPDFQAQLRVQMMATAGAEAEPSLFHDGDVYDNDDGDDDVYGGDGDGDGDCDDV